MRAVTEESPLLNTTQNDDACEPKEPENKIQEGITCTDSLAVAPSTTEACSDSVTHCVYAAALPQFLESCPTAVSFSGLLTMGSSLLTA